ncbi:hypothetical protein GXW82_17060 [Streptacidiphilus sp. 4-A2]|nr:hypothetical protein [Streptacidiphilus sp. 4-A2]
MAELGHGVLGMDTDCEASGADVHQLADALRLDRIGPAGMRPGLGFGGGCLPKDILLVLQARRPRRQQPRLRAGKPPGPPPESGRWPRRPRAAIVRPDGGGQHGLGLRR